MGSGKSTIANQIAKNHNLPLIDLDKHIENKENQTITSIFQSKGELNFRKIENASLQKVLAQDEFILSTGGGTPVFYNNMQLINQQSTSFYLYASPTELAQRLIPQKQHRPLIAHLNDNQLPEFIAKHLFERNPYYQQAHYIIQTNNKTVEEIAKEIVELIKNHP